MLTYGHAARLGLHTTTAIGLRRATDRGKTDTLHTLWAGESPFRRCRHTNTDAPPDHGVGERPRERIGLRSRTRHLREPTLRHSQGLRSGADIAAVVADAGSQVDDPVGVGHDRLVVGDDDDRRAGVDEAA